MRTVEEVKKELETCQDCAKFLEKRKEDIINPSDFPVRLQGQIEALKWVLRLHND